VPWSTPSKGQVDEGYFKVPLGKAELVRAGRSGTIITYGTMVHVAVAAAAALNMDAEIIDIRSLVPLDVDTICTSVKKTGRCVVAHEATRFSGFGAEILSTVQESASGPWRRRSSASPAGTRHIRTRSSGSTFPAKRASRRPSRLCDGTCMSQFTFQDATDLGEGTVDAEIVAWHTKPGDVVAEDQLIVEVMTDKAAVEVPAPVSGRVVSVTGAPRRQGGRRFAIDRVRIERRYGGGRAGRGTGATPGGQRPGAGRCAGRCAGRTNGRTAGRTARGGQGPRDDIAGESAPRARGGDRSCQVAGSGPGGRICEPTCRPARSARRRAYATDAADTADTTESKSSACGASLPNA